MNNFKFAGGISGDLAGGISGAHEVPFVALLTRVSRRRWGAGGAITTGGKHSAAFRNSVGTL